MTEKQKIFAIEYLKDLNASRAYKAAYPGVKKDATAGQAGSRLLKNVKVRAYIDKQLEKIQNDKIADATEVIQYLTSVMRGESQSDIVVVEGTGDGCSEASRMNKAPDEKERLKAAELLGKRYKLFTDRVEAAAKLDAPEDWFIDDSSDKEE